MDINVDKLITTCDTIARRCTRIADTGHGSAWLFDKLMRAFEASPACVSITIPVYVNLVGEGNAEIGRDGSLIMRRA